MTRPWPSPWRPLWLLLLLLVAACAAADHESRLATAAGLARAGGLAAVDFATGAFVLTGALRGAASGQPVLTVYLEGDGLAWTSRTQRSDDPTPRHPVGLALAAADSGPAVLYLARPCQYGPAAAASRGCDPAYWSERRFAPVVIAATNQAIDQAKRLVGARRVVLIGYSGGGVVAALAAARREDVAGWASVAAPLDPAAWTRWHGVAPLTGSLNPLDDAGRLAALPQHHFAGAADSIVPPALIRAFLAAAGGAGGAAWLTEVAGFDHGCCWAERWPVLRPLIPEPR